MLQFQGFFFTQQYGFVLLNVKLAQFRFDSNFQKTHLYVQISKTQTQFPTNKFKISTFQNCVHTNIIIL